MVGKEVSKGGLQADASFAPSSAMPGLTGGAGAVCMLIQAWGQGDEGFWGAHICQCKLGGGAGWEAVIFGGRSNRDQRVAGS